MTTLMTHKLTNIHNTNIFVLSKYAIAFLNYVNKLLQYLEHRAICMFYKYMYLGLFKHFPKVRSVLKTFRKCKPL